MHSAYLASPKRRPENLWRLRTFWLFLTVGASAAMAASGCDRVAGPQAMAAAALSESAAPGRVLEVSGCGEMTIRRAVFSRLLVKPEGTGIVAVATVDLEAAVGTAGTKVSYLGLERVPFTCDSVRCVPTASPLPSLTALLTKLCGRRDARHSDAASADGDSIGSEKAPENVSAAGRGESVSRWLIRVDRSQAEVLEERPDRRERFVLKNENGTFSFASGVY